MKFKTFNDYLAVVLVFLIPGLWVTNHWLQLPESVVGATIASWTMIIMFYFRKKAPSK